MKLQTVYARFYKSFNFDQLRKAHKNAVAKPWETYEGEWYPYVEVPIDQKITAVVGANESGKSHLLSAIEKAISGDGFEQRDLCRYSPFFNVERGKTCWPHLGVGFGELDELEESKLKAALGIEAQEAIKSFVMLREGPDSVAIYIPDSAGKHTAFALKDHAAKEFGKDFLPLTFKIKPDVALPNFIPLAWIASPDAMSESLMSRKIRQNYIHAGAALQPYWRSDPTQFAGLAQQMISAANSFFAKSEAMAAVEEHNKQGAKLARALLIELADIEPARLSDLAEAIANNDDGHANALMSRINDQLAKRINFPKWWVQDRDFSLQVTSRELDLVFTVKDRTGTEYTFAERSSGLKYFLSYLIQSQVHERPSSRSEILLMDEPDAYLSAEAQQDLLKIFSAFAEPADDARPVQVIYVTHSPFLLDKNHSERIRVLQKGRGRDGTRVIRNASKNHYEPLRSAFGSFVGETAFVGASNLLVEGAADQIVLAGIARLTRKASPALENDTLDLNRLVIVPCGSASQVPYMLYLIRGRDAEKPPVIALLDSDKSGDETAQLLAKDRKLRHLLQKEFVIQYAGMKLFAPSEPTQVTLEDIVPPSIALAAANACLAENTRFRDAQVIALTSEELVAARTSYVPMLDAINKIANAKGAHVEKIAFARSLINVVEHPVEYGLLADDVTILLDRTRKVFRAINSARRRAERDSLRERIGTFVERQQTIFAKDHPHAATKEQAGMLFEQIEESLDESNESDAVRLELSRLRKDFQLDEEIQDPVNNYEDFVRRLGSLKDAFHISQIEQKNNE